MSFVPPVVVVVVGAVGFMGFVVPFVVCGIVCGAAPKFVWLDALGGGTAIADVDVDAWGVAIGAGATLVVVESAGGAVVVVVRETLDDGRVAAKTTAAVITAKPKRPPTARTTWRFSRDDGWSASCVTATLLVIGPGCRPTAVVRLMGKNCEVAGKLCRTPRKTCCISRALEKRFSR